GHLGGTALFAQRFHENARLSYARWGTADNEVDLVESSPALKPIAALESKWSDRSVSRPELLKGLVKFVRNNRRPMAWSAARTQFGKQQISGSELRQRPAAVLAFHYGTRAVQGRLADYEARIKGITD